MDKEMKKQMSATANDFIDWSTAMSLIFIVFSRCILSKVTQLTKDRKYTWSSVTSHILIPNLTTMGHHVDFKTSFLNLSPPEKANMRIYMDIFCSTLIKSCWFDLHFRKRGAKCLSHQCHRRTSSGSPKNHSVQGSYKRFSSCFLFLFHSFFSSFLLSFHKVEQIKIYIHT